MNTRSGHSLPMSQSLFDPSSPLYMHWNTDRKVRAQLGPAVAHCNHDLRRLLACRGASRTQQLSLLLDAAEGKHKDASFLHMTRVAALVIEPLGTGTWMTVDGEVVAYEPIYLEVHQGLLNVVTAPMQAGPA